jgi:cytochrome c5
MKKLFTLSVIAAIVIAACTKDNYEKDNPKQVTPTPTPSPTPTAIDTCKDSIKYSVQIKRIMKNSCVDGCHNGVDQGSNFQDYATVAADTAQIVSRMNDASNPMPPSGLVDQCKRDQVKAWVKAGAKNN